jgi:hypothetical protein
VPHRLLVLLADTTVLYSALAYRGLENKVLFAGSHVFVTTEFTVAEMHGILTRKRGLGRQQAFDVIRSMPVLVADLDFIKEGWNEAFRMMGGRDKSDVPLVALALSLEEHDGIWSSDKDFDAVKDRFRIWKTRELLKA